jgi:hypothetical protein
VARDHEEADTMTEPDHPNVCVDVDSLTEASIHRELGDCVHLVGYGHRYHHVRCATLRARLAARELHEAMGERTP